MTEPLVPPSAESRAEEETSETTVPYANIVTSKKTFKRRWYILLLYGFLCGLQGFVWNMWGPIFDSMNFIYGWSNRQIAFFPFYGTISFCLLVIPSALFLEKWGLRKLILTMSTLVTVSAIIKCIPGSNTVITVFVNISAVLNGIAGAVVAFVPPYISAHWFATKERKLATAITTCMGGLGVSMAFIVGPWFISEPGRGISVETIQEQYFRYNYTLTGVSCLIFLAVVCYFPSKPPLPPSDSALVKRLDFFIGFKTLMTLKNYWWFCISSLLLLGTFSGWGPVLAIDLARRDVGEKEAGWIGFYSSIAGFFLGLTLSAVADRCGHLKAILIGTTLLSIDGSLWLLLILHGYLAFSMRSIYFVTTLASATATAVWAIRFELASEIAYPVDEALSVGFLGLTINLWSSVFLSGMFFNLGTVWIDYCLVICTLISLPFLLYTKESYNRSAVDNAPPQEPLNSDPINV